MALMTREEFEENLQYRDISLVINNISISLQGYSGQQIHNLPALEFVLGQIIHWNKLGWFEKGGIKTFSELKNADRPKYHMLINDLHAGLERGLFKI